MASAANETELHARHGVERRKHLLVTLGVNNDVCQQWHAGRVQGIASKASIQNFNGNVLDARAMFGQATMYGSVVIGAYKYNSDSAGFGINNRGIIGCDDGESHAREKCCGGVKVGNCDNYMVDTACNCVEFRTLGIAGLFHGRWFGA